MMRRTTMLAAGLALVLSGCAGDGPGGVAPGGEFAAIQEEIFNPSCISSSCHSSSTRAGDLSLVAGESYAELVGVTPENAAAAERGLLRVVPEDVAASFLVAKVDGSLEPDEGTLMPIGAPPLDPDEISMIEIWIENGALPDGEE